MAAVGRSMVIRKAGTAIAAVRTKSFSWGGEPIDITSDDDAGVRNLLDAMGQQQIDLSVEGLTGSQVLRDAALTIGTGKKMTDISLLFPNGDTLTGDFVMTSYEESGTYNDAITFSASFQSSEDWVYTAP